LADVVAVRRALKTDAPAVDRLLSEWLDWKPDSGRLESIQRAITKAELLVAQDCTRIIGFIHYVMHEDIIDGGANSFITAFYESPSYRRKGLGTLLLERAIVDSLAMGAVGVETSTIHTLAKKLYERHHFKQTMGDMGEVLLELDISEYLRAKERGNISKN
jgi:GNAT superfamily N-acetyltransferase